MKTITIKDIAKMIGLIVPDSSNPIFSIINREIGKLGRNQSYDIVICESGRIISS